MFKIEKPKAIKWPVTVSIPRDGGNAVKATFTAEFKLISATEFNAIYADKGTDEDLVRTVTVGWGSDLCDEDGQPLAFNEENLNMIAAVPYIRAAIVDTYLDMSKGKKPGAKN